MMRHPEEPGQRSHRPRRNYVKSAFNLLDLRASNVSVFQFQGLDGSIQELGAEAARFYHRYGAAYQGSNYDAGESGTRSDVQPSCPIDGLKADELRRVEDVALPELTGAKGGDQVLTLILRKEKPRIMVDSCLCFT